MQDLARFYNYADNQRYDLNGQAKPGTSPSFWLVDLHANYQFSKAVSAYLGVNNLLDYKQADKDSFLWVDHAGAMDVTHILVAEPGAIHHRICLSRAGSVGQRGCKLRGADAEHRPRCLRFRWIAPVC